jgi:hypothetical protein
MGREQERERDRRKATRNYELALSSTLKVNRAFDLVYNFYDRLDSRSIYTTSMLISSLAYTHFWRALALTTARVYNNGKKSHIGMNKRQLKGEERKKSLFSVRTLM